MGRGSGKTRQERSSLSRRVFPEATENNPLYGTAQPRRGIPSVAPELLKVLKASPLYENQRGWSGSELWLVKNESLPEEFKKLNRAEPTEFDDSEFDSLVGSFKDLSQRVFLPVSFQPTDFTADRDRDSVAPRKMLALHFFERANGTVVSEAAKQLIEDLCDPGEWMIAILGAILGSKDKASSLIYQGENKQLLGALAIEPSDQFAKTLVYG